MSVYSAVNRVQVSLTGGYLSSTPSWLFSKLRCMSETMVYVFMANSVWRGTIGDGQGKRTTTKRTLKT
jgi:hypothetical protein